MSFKYFNVITYPKCQLLTWNSFFNTNYFDAFFGFSLTRFDCTSKFIKTKCDFFLLKLCSEFYLISRMLPNLFYVYMQYLRMEVKEKSFSISRSHKRNSIFYLAECLSVLLVLWNWWEKRVKLVCYILLSVFLRDFSTGDKVNLALKCFFNFCIYNL